MNYTAGFVFSSKSFELNKSHHSFALSLLFCRNFLGLLLLLLLRLLLLLVRLPRGSPDIPLLVPLLLRLLVVGVAVVPAPNQGHVRNHLGHVAHGLK